MAVTVKIRSVPCNGSGIYPFRSGRLLIACVIAALLLLTWFVVSQIGSLFAAKGVASGFGFLFQPAAIPIAGPLIPYQPYVDTYARALLAGVLNTLMVSGAGLLGATILGLCVGLTRLSKHPLITLWARCYIELFRNIPIVLQLMFWYIILLHMPNARQAFSLWGGVFLSNRGLSLPWPVLGIGSATGWWLCVAGGLAAIALLIARLPSWRESTSMQLSRVMILTLAAAIALASSLSMEFPRKGGFSIVGGTTLSAEFSALVFGLSVYFSTYVGEIVRSGILGVPKGQREAAEALGLSSIAATRFVILPQALRLIIPPVMSQYANLIKTSSLAVVIGYQDVVSISNAMLTQTGQAVETVILIAAIYLTINLVVGQILRLFDSSLPGMAAATKRTAAQ